MIYVECEASVESVAEETKELGGKLLHFLLVQHMSHITWLGPNTGRRVGNLATNRLNCLSLP
jgi:hypothetical protein